MRTIKMLGSGALLLLSLSMPIRVRADVDPEATLKAMSAHFDAGVQEAKDKNKDPDIEALRKQVADKAKESVKGVDPQKIEPTKGLAWALLFNIADEPRKMIVAAERFLTSNPAPQLKFNAQMTLLDGYLLTEDADAFVKTMQDIKPASPGMAVQIAITAANDIGLVADKKGAKAGLALLKHVEDQVPFDQFLTPRGVQTADRTAFEIANARADLLENDGRHAEAIASLEEGAKHLSPHSAYAPDFASKTALMKMTGAPAPAHKHDRRYGEFPGLEAYKGKVVILDFMAHWCAGCKLALPDLKKLYADLHAKGLEVVSVTGYYGGYGKEKGLTPEAEFAKMAGFIAENGMTWPMIFGDASNAEHYIVNGIPHFVVIDPSGRVNSVTIGYSPALLAKMRQTVESLLGKQASAK